MKKLGFLILGILFVDIYFIYQHVSHIQNDGHQMLSVDSPMLRYLYSNVNPSNDVTVLKGLYQDKVLHNSYILSIGLANYLNENSMQNSTYIKALEVERRIHSILGYDISFVHGDTFLLSSGICGYRYDSTRNQYERMEGCSGNSREAFSRKIVSAEKTGDWILIYEKLIYFYDDKNAKYDRKFVYDSFKRERVLNFFETASVDISIEDYLNDASTYVYYFRLKNGNYIFDRIQKIS